MQKVAVLMSTYNGEKYIKEQLDSLLNQTHKNIKIIIRDDGSKDKTTEILLEYKKKYSSKIELLLEKNIGVVESFFKLLYLVEENYDYYCLCDQDDYWLPEKIEKALLKLEESLKKHSNHIGLYFSNLTLTDCNLNIKEAKMKKQVIPTLRNSIFQNDLYGCTSLFTKEYLFILKKGIEKIDSQKIFLHDHFIYIVGNIFSKVVYDENSYILYRQHQQNVSGASLSFRRKVIKILKKYGSINSKISNQPQEIERVYNKLMIEDKKKVFQEILGLKKSLFKRVIFIIKDYPYTNNSILGRIVFSLIIILNRF
ncbi:MAG: glycosyltransferase family 2 protein [Cetobacterium sp.]